jgi:hypothetical protein
MLHAMEKLVISNKPKNSVMRYTWTVVKVGNNVDEIDDYFYFNAPKSSSKYTNPEGQYCAFKEDEFKTHKLDIQMRKCSENNSCVVKYKVFKCSSCKKWQILSNGNHDHAVMSTYNNLNGIHPKWKEKINDCLEKNIKQPKDEDNCGMFHSDYTYKITKNNFPLLVLGRSDVRRRFRSIAYMISSQETAVDFQFFYNEIKLLLMSIIQIIIGIACKDGIIS